MSGTIMLAVLAGTFVMVPLAVVAEDTIVLSRPGSRTAELCF